MARKPKAKKDQAAKSTHGGARPGAGRPRRYTLSETEVLHKARSLGRRSQLRVVKGWRESLKAMEPIFWQGNQVAVVVNETARAEARRQLADRYGDPKRTQVESVSMGSALASLLEPDDDIEL